ncbi:NAD(P)-dependent oxidoreductase [Falsirhodobacter sp. 20TX0035]|uniref:NAD(P)-dependent oxidoreductase n=1 Tax=Falsirhodobacter sp. 20TX0035 TaxID=3022019 RepID=UPI00232CDD8C|nr:NAD(P)-dependent oxidoreductase [Falsirhodobacter sp. 20TX0035]MDB6454186.1 NAD(P)-dependent oxidoreductase [Falsirhodobacter sp. 20TX0035]
MVKIVTTSPGFGTAPRVAARLDELGWTLVRCADAVTLAEQIEDADFFVVGLIGPSPEVLDRATRLKGVLKHGVGVDNIDIPACSARTLPVANTPGANADAVAELAIGMMFAMARQIPQGHVSVTSGGWDRKAGVQLGGKTLGVVGLGNIGRKLALLALGLGMMVVATDPYADAAFAQQHGIELLDLDSVLARSDYLSLHVFGGADNAALINAERLGRMKPGARLLNLARGEVVDLDAVHEALVGGHLAGAAIDAYAVEPPDTSHPIFSHPNAIFMPHSGADTVEALENVGLMNIADMQDLLDGRRPSRVLN